MALSLRYTRRGLSPAIKDDLRATLEPYFGEVEESEVFLASDQAPTWVRLVADLVTWKAALAGAVSIFLKRLIEHAADDAWSGTEGIRRALGDKACKALRDVATAIRAAQQAGGEEFSVALVFSTPEGAFGTALTIRSDSVEDAAHYVARFVERADAINRFVEAQIPLGILGPVELTLLPDGTFRIAWLSRDSKLHEGVIR